MKNRGIKNKGRLSSTAKFIKTTLLNKYKKLKDKDATNISRKIEKDFKDGEKITKKNIYDKYKEYLKKEKDKIKFYEKWLKPRHYWELADFPDDNKMFIDKKFKIISKVSYYKLPPIIGNQYIKYEEYFKDFVDYCNLIKKEEGEEKYTEEWFVKCTTPNKNNISYLISCDSDGNEYDYGYDRKRKKNVYESEIEKSKEPETEIEKPKEPETEIEKPKEPETEIEKPKEPETEIEKPKESETEREKEIDLINKKIELMEKKIKMIKELKELGFTNQEIIDIMKGI
ncbi:MAG: hypothetical protein QXM96_01615 [Candidatus Woesearchaeota archaeon]